MVLRGLGVWTSCESLWCCVEGYYIYVCGDIERVVGSDKR